MKLIQTKYYTFQHRKIMESLWLQRSPLKMLDPLPKWSFVSWTHFGSALNPLTIAGEYKYPNTRQCHDVWSITGSHGFWDLTSAKKALIRLQEANKEGCWDFIGMYGNYCQAIRYEFRIVKVTHTDDIIELVEE